MQGVIQWVLGETTRLYNEHVGHQEITAWKVLSSDNYPEFGYGKETLCLAISETAQTNQLFH